MPLEENHCEGCGEKISEKSIRCLACANTSRGNKNRVRRHADFKKRNNIPADAPDLCPSCEFYQGRKQMRGERTASACKWFGNISNQTFKCSSYLKKEVQPTLLSNVATRITNPIKPTKT